MSSPFRRSELPDPRRYGFPLHDHFRTVWDAESGHFRTTAPWTSANEGIGDTEEESRRAFWAAYVEVLQASDDEVNRMKDYALSQGYIPMSRLN